ncbi:hypothetical protein [Oscillibacter sp.]|uniref:hypothetical protein n=1 Tax=Oscillibacter sp. TaxID=1945593 RepID=UPI0028A91249|nr:hypothetical protein [Oscillibacter sp.]
MTGKTKPLTSLKKRMLALLAAMSLMALTACTGQPPAGSSGSAGQASSSGSTQAGTSSAGSSQAEKTESMGLSDLTGLLGLTQEELIAAMGDETPETVDEGGLGFEKAGIRVWFDTDTYTKVAQVLVMTDRIDLNGLHLGDSLSDFTEVFGQPLSDKDGDAHFAYEDHFLSVVYDTDSASNTVISVYVLQENF